MSVQIVKQPNNYCFAGNPVLFTFRTDSLDEFSVTVNVAGEAIILSLYPYNVDGSFFADLDISDLLQGRFREYSVSDSEIITLIENFRITYLIYVNEVLLFAGDAYRGGVSKSFSKYLLKNHIQDIFKYRLKNKFRQFLFTTRTNGRDIRIKRSELFPFIFIHPGGSISFRSEQGDVIGSSYINFDNICLMDISLLCSEFNRLHGYIPSVIDILLEDRIPFRIFLEQPVSTEERCLVRFRNSLGAFEVIELTGRAYQTPQFDEEFTWQENVGENVFEERRDRLSSRETIEVESGFKNREEMDFLQDMIKSDEAYFIYPDGIEQRCHITVDTMRFRNRIVSPTSIPLKIRMVDDEVFVSPYNSATVNPLVLSTESGSILKTEDNNNNILV